MAPYLALLAVRHGPLLDPSPQPAIFPPQLPLCLSLKFTRAGYSVGARRSAKRVGGAPEEKWGPPTKTAEGRDGLGGKSRSQGRRVGQGRA